MKFPKWLEDPQIILPIVSAIIGLIVLGIIIRFIVKNRERREGQKPSRGNLTFGSEEIDTDTTQRTQKSSIAESILRNSEI